MSSWSGILKILFWLRLGDEQNIGLKNDGKEGGEGMG